jgi:hypothetical protein
MGRTLLMAGASESKAAGERDDKFAQIRVLRAGLAGQQR